MIRRVIRSIVSVAVAALLVFGATSTALPESITASPTIRYATGTCTPTVTFATPGDLAVTYGLQFCNYTVIGNRAFVSMRIATASFTYTTASGLIRIAGLPFAAASSSETLSAIFGGYTAVGYSQVAAETTSGQSYLQITAGGSGVAPTGIGSGQVASGGALGIYVSGFYTIP